MEAGFEHARLNNSLRDSGSLPRLPAFVLLDPGTTRLRVAALSVLDRLLVSLHRAGCESLVVVGNGKELPALPRTVAWGIRFQVVSQPPPRTGPTVVVRSDTLVQVEDLRALASGPVGTRLATGDGEPLPVGCVDAGTGDPEAALESSVLRRACGVACRVRNTGEAAQASKALWASITSSSDGWVDKVFNRPAGRPLSRLLVRTPVTPNAISIASTLLGLVAAFLFAQGAPALAVIAAVVFQLSAVVDCVDGDVARAVFKETPIGKWVDLVGDQVVHIAVFVGIARGCVVAGYGPAAGWLGVSAAIGAACAFLAVLRGMRLVRLRGGGGGGMQQILDAVTNRDFSVLVLILALVDRLEWFLWLAGVGIHAFWVGLLVLQQQTAGRRGDPR